MVKQDPEAAAELHRRSRQAEIQQAAEAQTMNSVAEEIKEAQRQIAEQQANRTVSEMSADELRNELLKRDAQARTQSGDE